MVQGKLEGQAKKKNRVKECVLEINLKWVSKIVRTTTNEWGREHKHEVTYENVWCAELTAELIFSQSP